MERRDTISILENILHILNKEKSLSFNQLQKKTKTQWRTLVRCVNFLLKSKLIKEEKVGDENNYTRLFKLFKQDKSL